jgi:RimJ/RimL family protein N-acetyltransferase
MFTGYRYQGQFHREFEGGPPIGTRSDPSPILYQDDAMDLSDWSGAPRPEPLALDGRYARLEPFDRNRHAKDLFEASSADGAQERFRYLFEEAPADIGAFNLWFDRVSPSPDPLFFAVIDKSTGRAGGRQALMRIDVVHGVIEIGHILWGPAIARGRVATEALYLFADYIFGLGYRRFEWKCNDGNEPSKRAAQRFGFQFEGVFRQHMVVKGQNRDTAWFAMTDGEWPRLKAGYEAWLQPENFDASGQQRNRLTF